MVLQLDDELCLIIVFFVNYIIETIILQYLSTQFSCKRRVRLYCLLVLGRHIALNRNGRKDAHDKAY